MKLIKVIFEYKDGTAEYLDGVDLTKWHVANNASAMMMYVRGGKSGYEDIKYKRVKKKRYSSATEMILRMPGSLTFKLRWLWHKGMKVVESLLPTCF